MFPLLLIPYVLQPFQVDSLACWFLWAYILHSIHHILKNSCPCPFNKKNTPCYNVFPGTYYRIFFFFCWNRRCHVTWSCKIVLLSIIYVPIRSIAVVFSFFNVDILTVYKFIFYFFTVIFRLFWFIVILPLFLIFFLSSLCLLIFLSIDWICVSVISFFFCPFCFSDTLFYNFYFKWKIINNKIFTLSDKLALSNFQVQFSDY